MEMTVKEVLIAARAKIADPANWTHGASARNVHGSNVFSRSSDAVCWCSLGAVAAVTTDPDEFDEACMMLASFMDMSAISFNDTHTHAEVLAKFDEAIAAQGGE